MKVKNKSTISSGNERKFTSGFLSLALFAVLLSSCSTVRVITHDATDSITVSVSPDQPVNVSVTSPINFNSPENVTR